MHLRDASISALIVLATAASMVGCGGSPRAGGTGSDVVAGGVGSGPGSGPGLGAGVAAQQDWGLVVRTWVIDDTRGTQINVYTPDPDAQAGPTPASGDDESPKKKGAAASNAPTPSPRTKDEQAKAPLLNPLRPDWRAAIAAVAVASPVDQATLAAWRANGIEVIGVPVERIAALESVLTKVGFRQSQDMGETPKWTEVAKGPEWQGDQRLVLDNGPVTLGPGRMRMLLRTWVVPGQSTLPKASDDVEVVTGVDAGDGARAGANAEMVPGAVRVEMAPQHMEASASRTSLADLLKPQDAAQGSDGRGEGAARAGLILSRLTAAATLNGDMALLVLASDAGLQAVGDPTTGGWIAQKPDRAGTTTVGPMAPGDMRLGPAILTSGPDGMGVGSATGVVGGQRAWTVLILIPRAPDRYELLGL